MEKHSFSTWSNICNLNCFSQLHIMKLFSLDRWVRIFKVNLLSRNYQYNLMKYKKDEHHFENKLQNPLWVLQISRDDLLYE